MCFCIWCPTWCGRHIYSLDLGLCSQSQSLDSCKSDYLSRFRTYILAEQARVCTWKGRACSSPFVSKKGSCKMKVRWNVQQLARNESLLSAKNMSVIYNACQWCVHLPMPWQILLPVLTNGKCIQHFQEQYFKTL